MYIPMYIIILIFLFIMWRIDQADANLGRYSEKEVSSDAWMYESTTQYTVTPPPREHLSCVEKQMILEGLERYKWNTRLFAKELGISRAGLLTKIAKYKLEKKG